MQELTYQASPSFSYPVVRPQIKQYPNGLIIWSQRRLSKRAVPPTFKHQLDRITTATTTTTTTMATEDERYRTSSQFREWSFTPAQLADTRSKTNSLARKAIGERLASASSSSSSASANPSGANTPIPAAVSTATAPADVPHDLLSAADAAAAPSLSPEFLTPAEEEQLLRYYTVETLRAAEFCGLPTEIRATAAVFLRRFYLTHSVMTYPPTKMLKTCVFFGAKAENYYPRVKSIADKFPKTTGEEILAGEFLLCQGIRFGFDVRHPFRALEGAIMQLRSFGDLDVGSSSFSHGTLYIQCFLVFCNIHD